MVATLFYDTRPTLLEKRALQLLNSAPQWFLQLIRPLITPRYFCSCETFWISKATVPRSPQNKPIRSVGYIAAGTENVMSALLIPKKDGLHESRWKPLAFTLPPSLRAVFIIFLCTHCETALLFTLTRCVYLAPCWGFHLSKNLSWKTLKGLRAF